MKPWLNVSEAAEYAGVSRDTIYTACERHELRSARVSGRRAIRIRPVGLELPILVLNPGMSNVARRRTFDLR